MMCKEHDKNSDESRIDFIIVLYDLIKIITEKKED